MVRTLENNYSICQKQQINSPGKKIAAYPPTMNLNGVLNAHALYGKDR